MWLLILLLGIHLEGAIFVVQVADVEGHILIQTILLAINIAERYHNSVIKVVVERELSLGIG